jgi:hypothetical protein
MALRQNKKISELPVLSSTSLDVTYIVGISGSTTYKILGNQLTSSLNINTGSLVTTSSFNSYTASVTASVPNGTISGSSQLTSSFDTRYALSGSGGSIPGGTISGSSQLINLGFPTTSSTDTLTNKTLSNPLIGSFKITSDSLSRMGTYGNNVEFFSKDGFLLNPTTDRAVYIDTYDNNNKVVITSDLASYETRGRSIVSSSAQITAFGFISSSSTPAGTISGSSQLTSSYDTRYALSASFVSSSTVLSIQTLSSASYAALTPPISGTLYIIIG